MGQKPQQLRDSDILDEKYKGANAAVAAAGEAYYAHYWMAFVGLVGGMAGALLFHKSIGTQINTLRDSAKGWANSKNVLVEWTGKSIHGIFGTGRGNLGETRQVLGELLEANKANPHSTDVYEKAIKEVKFQERGFGYWLLDHTIYKIPSVKENLSKIEGINTAVSAGGLLGAFGFFVAPWLYAVKGVHNANEGKDQFKRAQQEVRELREDLQFVEDKNAELRKQMRNDEIVVSKDVTPKVANHPTPTPHDPHELDVQAKRKDHTESPVSITPPKIEPPEPAAPPVDGPKSTIHASTVHADKEIATHHGQGDRHAQHKNHSDRHKVHGSHGDAVHASQAAAATHGHTAG